MKFIKTILFLITLICVSAICMGHTYAQSYLNGNTNYPLVMTYNGSSTYIDLMSAYIKSTETMPDKTVLSLTIANMVVVDKDNKIQYHHYSAKIGVDKKTGQLIVFTYVPGGYMYNKNTRDVGYISAKCIVDYMGIDKFE